MNTTININLAGMAFQIDDDAYKMLRSYLESIERELTSEDSSEVMRDIESRVAELFRDLCRQQRVEVVTAEMVRAVIAQLGKPADFKDEEEAEQSSFSAMLKRKLYRDPSNKIIAGVCSGLGHWFGIDAIWVRLIFLLCLLLWGVTLPIYLVLWLVMPEAQTAAQRLSMRGEQATVENIEREYELDKVSADKGNTNNGCLMTGVKILIFCIGLFFLFIAGMIFFGVITGLLGATTGLAATTPLGVIGAFFSGDYWLAGLLTLLILIVICMPIFLLARALLRHFNNKEGMSRSSMVIALLIWLAALAGSIGLGLYELSRSDADWIDRIEMLDDDRMDLGNGLVAGVAETITSETFNAIKVEGAANIGLTQGEECYAEGNLKLLKRAEVKDGVLCIRTKDNLRKGTLLWVQVKDLRSIRLEGAANCKVPSQLNLESLDIHTEGACKLDLNLQVDSLTVTAEGASEIELKGMADMLKIKVEGVADIDAEDLVARSAEVTTEGPSKVELNVTDHLKTHSSALGKITYTGSPTVERYGNGGKVKRKK